MQLSWLHTFHSSSAGVFPRGCGFWKRSLFRRKWHVWELEGDTVSQSFCLSGFHSQAVSAAPSEERSNNFIDTGSTNVLSSLCVSVINVILKKVLETSTPLQNWEALCFLQIKKFLFFLVCVVHQLMSNEGSNLLHINTKRAQKESR